MVTSKNFQGSTIICEYDSTNLKKGEYDTVTKKLRVVFNNDGVYEYDDVSHETFAEMNQADSQGKYFNANIKKSHAFRKVITT